MIIRLKRSKPVLLQWRTLIQMITSVSSFPTPISNDVRLVFISLCTQKLNSFFFRSSDGITAEHLKHAMELNPKVKCSLIAIGEGAEATWLPNALPGKAHRVTDTSGIATALRTILASALGAGGL